MTVNADENATQPGGESGRGDAPGRGAGPSAPPVAGPDSVAALPHAPGLSAEDAPREREQMLSAVLASLPGAVYRSELREPWRTTFLSGGFRSLLGRDPEGIARGDVLWADLVHPDDVHMLTEDTDRDLAAGSATTQSEYRVITADGEERWVLDRALFVRDAGGRPVELIGMLIDVTELQQHRMERALRESEQRYRALFDGSPVGIFVLDRDLVFVDCNAAFETMFGVTAGDFRDGSAQPLVPEGEILRTLQSALKGHEGVYEGSCGISGGRRLWVTVKVAPRFDAEGGVAGVTGVVLDQTRQKDGEEQIRHLLLHDPVSGLANRALLEERVGQALKHAHRRRLSFALAAFRVDRFDAVEASLGLQGVDQLLGLLGQRLQGALRSEDTVAYLGAGSFAVLLPGAAGPAEATAAVAGLLTAAGESLTVDGRELYLTLSLGVALYPTDGATMSELLHNADSATRQASDGGGDRWQFFHPGLNEEQADRLTLEAELHRALDTDQFFLEYQPLVDAASEEIVGVEALVRWRHPVRGVVGPLDFIPVAEDAGVLGQIGARVLEEACRQGRAWQRRFGKRLRMSVNIGARQLHDRGLVETVRGVLRATGFDAHSLELEITETAAMRDARHTAQILGALRAMGVRVALDDFGTGYSSLSHLVRLPISTVKIDRSFVRDLLSVPEHAAVAASVIALGHRLGLTVVAEGVETVAERGALRDEGCDVIQGFLYAEPLPADACADVLAVGAIRR